MTPHRFAVALLAASLLSGCASQNPYDQSAQGDTNKTAVYGGLGALAGAAAPTAAPISAPLPRLS